LSWIKAASRTRQDDADAPDDRRLVAITLEPPMTPRHLLTLGALALALAACSQPAAPPAAEPAPAPATDAAPAAPAETAPAPSPAAAIDARQAVVADCATTLEANDAMQYNANAIVVPATCTQFTINLKHVGTMPVAAMGHNVVVSKEADMAAIAADGAAVTPDHVKAGDTRVIAQTKMIGGGESTAVTFDVAKVKDGGPFKFFCSFPGHMAMMQGSLEVM
jgi:azurin